MNYRRRRNVRLVQLRAARILMTVDMYFLFTSLTDHYHGSSTEGDEVSGPNGDDGIRWCEQSHLKRGTMKCGWRYLLYTTMILVFSYFSYEFFQCQTGCAIVHTREVTAEDAFFTVRGTPENPLVLMKVNAGRCIEPAAMPRPHDVGMMRLNAGGPRNECFQEECTGLESQGRPMNYGLFSPAVPQAWPRLLLANGGYEYCFDQRISVGPTELMMRIPNVPDKGTSVYNETMMWPLRQCSHFPDNFDQRRSVGPILYQKDDNDVVVLWPSRQYHGDVMLYETMMWPLRQCSH